MPPLLQVSISFGCDDSESDRWSPNPVQHLNIDGKEQYKWKVAQLTLRAFSYVSVSAARTGMNEGSAAVMTLAKAMPAADLGPVSSLPLAPTLAFWDTCSQGLGNQRN